MNFFISLCYVLWSFSNWTIVSFSSRNFLYSIYFILFYFSIYFKFSSCPRGFFLQNSRRMLDFSTTVFDFLIFSHLSIFFSFYYFLRDSLYLSNLTGLEILFPLPFFFNFRVLSCSKIAPFLQGHY